VVLPLAGGDVTMKPSSVGVPGRKPGPNMTGETLRRAVSRRSFLIRASSRLPDVLRQVAELDVDRHLDAEHLAGGADGPGGRAGLLLLEGGRGAAVIDQRMAFQDVMRQRFEAVVEAATGCRVIGFMSGNQQHPDVICEVFILAPSSLFKDSEIALHTRASGEQKSASANAE
jgi:hypothetical protein